MCRTIRKKCFAIFILAQTHRLVPWLNRELNALMEAQAHQVPYVLQLILDLIQRFNIQSPEFHEQIVPYTGTRTNHFQHEFYNYARSTYDMIGYDRHAMYSAAQPVETYVVSSESSSSDEEAEIHVDEPLPSQNINSRNSSDNIEESVIVDDNVQPPSSSNTANIPTPDVQEPLPSTSTVQVEGNFESSFPLIISSGESDANVENLDDDVEVVHYVKPLKDRTPVIVNLDSSDEDMINKERENSDGMIKPEDSSVIPTSSSNKNAPSIITLGDSSPDGNDGLISSNANQKRDKPLWKRNFETCFPNSLENSHEKCSSKHKSKKQAKSRAMQCYSSSSEREKLKSRRKANSKEYSKVNKSNIWNYESSSSSSADDGGWFHHSETSTENELDANIRFISKGKGKGKGKSSKLGNNEKLEKIGRKGERTKKCSSKNNKSKTHRNTELESSKSSSNSDSSNSWYSDKEDKPLKSKKKDRLKSSKTKTKYKDKNIMPKKSKLHLAKTNGDNLSRVMKNSQEDTSRSNSASILTNSSKCSNKNSDDSNDSDNSQLLLTKNSNKRKTVFDSDTNSESLTDGNEDDHSSSRSIKEQSNVEKENQLRKRLLKKLKRKKRSSKKLKVSPTTSLGTKIYASSEKSPVLDYDYDDGEQNDRESENLTNETMNTSSSSIARISDLRDRLNQKKKYKTKHVNKSTSDPVLSDNDNESSIHNERVVITSIVSNDEDTTKQSNRIVTLHKSNNE